jgi:protein MBA1
MWACTAISQGMLQSPNHSWTRHFVDARKDAITHYAMMLIFCSSGKRSGLKNKCLSPLFKQFETRIVARGPLKMSWRLVKWKSARILSDRVSPLGEDHPDTAYRQVIVRLESLQTLTKTTKTSSHTTSRRPVWVPEEAKAKLDQAAREEEARDVEAFVDNGKQTKVVEYLVLQRRLIGGKEEDWKVWGFADVTTPESIEEDAAYWRKTLYSQVS